MKSSKRVYVSKILKAGAILDETRTLLGNWDNSESVQENLDRFRINNILGKASRSRVDDILQIFRQRYLVEEPVMKALIKLVKARYPTKSLDPILYFHTAMSNPLIHDFVIEILWPRYFRGRQDIVVSDAGNWIKGKISKGYMNHPWSDTTIEKSAQGLLSTLRDFGVLQGLNHKRLAPFYLPVDAFSYAAFYLSNRQPSGKRLLEAQDWRLFFLESQAVEHNLMEAHQSHFLEYHAAGSVVRISFPSESLEEYADVILERAH